MTLLLMGYLKILMPEIALAKSGVTPSWKQIDDSLPNSPFAVYITVLKDKFRVARLVRKIKAWLRKVERVLSLIGLQVKRPEYFVTNLCLYFKH